jgi:hypothetical protein
LYRAEPADAADHGVGVRPRCEIEEEEGSYAGAGGDERHGQNVARIIFRQPGREFRRQRTSFPQGGLAEIRQPCR